MRTCSVCPSIHYAKGYCHRHWRRWFNTGDPFGLRKRQDGTGTIRKRDGYILVSKDGKQRMAHVVTAERVLGRPLPSGAHVHHVNGNPSDNRHENLVICPDNSYHRLLHQRGAALEASGHADWRKCKYCKTYDDPQNLYIRKGSGVYHRKCVNEYQKENQ